MAVQCAGTPASAPFGEAGTGRRWCNDCAYDDPVTNKPGGIHQTWISRELNRMERGMLGSKGVVRLWPDDAIVHGISIGEGFESTLSGVLLTGRAPAWAALNAGNVARFPVLNGMEALTIFVDNEASGTGQTRARECAVRWSKAGREVRLLTPKLTGADMNDLLKGAA